MTVYCTSIALSGKLATHLLKRQLFTTKSCIYVQVCFWCFSLSENQILSESFYDAIGIDTAEKSWRPQPVGILSAFYWHGLTHWGRVTHICVNKLTIIGSDNGLSPGRRQAIIWTNDGILLIGPLGINFREILIEILTFSFKKMHLKMSSGKWRPSCLGLNVLTHP